MIKKIIRNITYVIQKILNPKGVFTYWFNSVPNFGDELNIFLVKELSEKKPVWVNPKYSFFKHYMAIGSIIQESSNKTIIWGSGIITERHIPEHLPTYICSVRGPLTRERLINLGINDCPKIFGDPALLLPYLYNPKVEKKHNYGLIPHHSEMDTPFVNRLKEFNNIKLIDVRTNNIFNFIDDLLSCKKILSSSLHGIIIADAYKIPSKRYKLKENPLDDFKFLDYFLSVNKVLETKIFSYEEYIDLKKIDFSSDFADINLIPMVEVCPFITESVKKALIKKLIDESNIK